MRGAREGWGTADALWQRDGRRGRFGWLRCLRAAEQGGGGGQRCRFRGAKCLRSLEMSGT